MDPLVERIIVELVMGLTNGMILALIASGFTLILGVMNIVNFAHGEFHMAGAYAGWMILLLIGPTAFGFWVTVVLAAVGVGLMGWLVERSVLADTHGGDPFNPLLITFGLALVFQQAALVIFGTVGKFVANPIEASIPLFDLQLPVYRLVIMAVAALIIFGLALFIKYTRWGVWIRAIVQNREMAACMGVPVPRVYQLVFSIGCGLAAASGVLVAPIFSVSASMGTDIIITAFIIVVIGGLGSLTGTIIAALLIGELETLGSLFVPGSQAQIFSFVVLMVFL
ncbi:MAG: branched-chain amino acid ABC transporter permease, partial [Alphaproteobacteria bacterium]|nr:branched-chain amino acid ABC transporter permease [Alphaproteobacteria bacterium]